MQMHLKVALRILICFCLVVFATAAKCLPEWCGSMNVSYPFWIHKSECGFPGFQINCMKEKSTGKLALFLPALYENATHYLQRNFKITEIDYTGHLIINSTSLKASSCNISNDERKLFELPEEGPYMISTSNRFVVIGCGIWGTYSYGEYGQMKCIPDCYNRGDKEYCKYGCCETVLADNWKSINFTGGGLFYYNHKNEKLCGFSTVFDPSTFEVVDENTDLFWGGGRKADYGLRLNWGIGLQNCSVAKSKTNSSCDVNAECIDSPTGEGHVCKCRPGYEGSGYSNGTSCTDVDECSRRDLNRCIDPLKGGVCHNFPGSYNCSCAKGYKGDGFQCLQSTNSKHVVIPAIIGSVSSFVVVSLAASVLIWWLKKRHLKLVEAKYFQQLQQYIVSRVGRETLRMFSAKELERACKNYSNDMELGSGGFGTVYKATLLDGTIVAVKKSKQVINLQNDHEFINEVTILSQINHRNIVKLFGCCLQTQLPLLVSEFVPNGTLFEHLHSSKSYLPWASRLLIAIETGEALTYLHSGACQPIFHRDVKSSNILLDYSFSPKVADFGISRLISTTDKTHLTTNIIGTRGYLDPEYFQTYQLTDKSDVYSFGVVLVELLTGLEPMSVQRANDEWILSSLFLSRLNNDRLIEILDSKVFKEENRQQMEDMALLARECLQLERKRRPSMKEVVEELIWIKGGTRKTRSHQSVSSKDKMSEQTSTSREASQSRYRHRSHTFPGNVVESTSEEVTAALIQMSTMPEPLGSQKYF